MTNLFTKFSKNISESGLKLRPNANHGLWLIFLLPFAVIGSHLKYPQEAFLYYKLCSQVSIGMLLTTIMYIYQCARRKPIALSMIHTGIAALICTFIFTSGRGFAFSAYSGILACLVFCKLYHFVLNSIPHSFSIGEGAVVSQACILFLYSTSMYLYDLKTVPIKPMQVATVISQIGLLGIAAICLLTYSFRTFHRTIPFYVMFAFGVCSFILIPLHIVLKRSPLLWILYFLTEDTVMIQYIVYVVACVMVAVFAINRQIREAKKASTIARKTFHILAVMVYFPGILYKCTFMYLASAVTLGVFISIEILRVLNLPPFGATLQDGFSVFCDDKDAGGIALTPIYLLVSVSLPLWIHPTPCDMTDSAGYNLLPLISGLLSVGVGDTAASVCGKLLGRHRWPGTNKTVEGTLGYILSQMAVIYVLIHFRFIGYCEYKLLKVGIAVVSTSLIEAFTSQVDNLALPLLMFIILV